MSYPRTILCPVDFSEPSRRALAWACRLLPDDGHLIVLNAVDPLLAEAARVRLGVDLATAESEPALRSFATINCVSALSPTAIAFKVQVGHASDVILETAAAVAAELIVMGTHGLSGFRKWFLGSTTEHVLRRTETSVLAIPTRTDVSSDVQPENVQIKKVLAATDFSDTSARALECAVSLAGQHRASLLLVHAVAPIAVPPWWRADMADVDGDRMTSARAQLLELMQPFSASVACEPIVTLGRPADAIAAVAENRQVQLIVMGLTGPGPWLGARPGSIAYGVLSLASTAVLVVPPQSQTAAAPKEAP